MKGSIFLNKPKTHWVIRYREPDPTTKNGWRDKYKALAPNEKPYTSEAQVRGAFKGEIDELLAPAKNGKTDETAIASAQHLGDFIEHVYFPAIERTKKPSTVAGYRAYFNKHLEHQPEMLVRLRDFKTSTGHRLLQRIGEKSNLAHNSLRNVRSLLWGIFTFAKQQGVLDSENPIADTSTPKGARKPKKTHAYALNEITSILDALRSDASDPQHAEKEVAQTVVAAAAFTGLRRSELRGLRWGDFDGSELKVSRAIWNTKITAPKTEESEAPVPVIPWLKDLLEEHRNGYGQDQYIFAGQRKGFALNLANLARRVIVPTLKAKGVAWHGWHSFRRGLATNLHALGTADKTIQKILRHSNINTTMNIYVKADPGRVDAAMAELEQAMKGSERASQARRQTA